MSEAVGSTIVMALWPGKAIANFVFAILLMISRSIFQDLFFRSPNLDTKSLRSTHTILSIALHIYWN